MLWIQTKNYFLKNNSKYTEFIMKIHIEVKSNIQKMKIIAALHSGIKAQMFYLNIF